MATIWLTHPHQSDPLPLVPAPASRDDTASTGGFIRRRRQVGKFVLFIASILLFALAIGLLKEGAARLTPLVRAHLNLDNPWHSLGFGWLFAYVVMSGSPVAAVALTFLDAGVLTPMSAFAMITGSRFGASFIVLLIGFIYILRGRSRSASMTMGLLALLVTASTHLVALPIGMFMLHQGWLDTVRINGSAFNSIFDLTIQPVVDFAGAHLPGWAIFFSGLGMIMLSFSFFDRCLPQMTLRESHLGRTARLVYKPWVMLLLGAGVTMISMSVSISLGILVPLSARGFIRRENVIPYIMGANVTTFVDTLLAALLMENQAAFTVVLVEMASMVIVSALVLTLIYRPFERSMLTGVSWCVESNRNLALFAVLILIIPIVLILL